MVTEEINTRGMLRCTIAAGCLHPKVDDRIVAFLERHKLTLTIHYVYRCARCKFINEGTDYFGGSRDGVLNALSCSNCYSDRVVIIGIAPAFQYCDICEEPLEDGCIGLCANCNLEEDVEEGDC